MSSPVAVTTPAESSAKKTPKELNDEITKQGDLVRNLKSKKAEKTEIDAAVKVLLALKSDYKAATNTDWKPGCTPPNSGPEQASLPPEVSELNDKILRNGDKVMRYTMLQRLYNEVLRI